MGGLLPVRFTRGITLYLFGNAMLHFNKQDHQYKPIILEPAPEEVRYTEEMVARITFFDEARDYYRFGIGIEISGLVSGAFKKFAKLFVNSK